MGLYSCTVVDNRLQSVKYCSYLEGAWFYHRVSQGVPWPFYNRSVVDKLLTVGGYHRSRTLPGVARFGGAPAFYNKTIPQMAEKGWFY